MSAATDQGVSCPELPDNYSAYMNQLAAEIVANGNPAGDLFAEMQAAHTRRMQAANRILTAEEPWRTELAHRLADKVYAQFAKQQLDPETVAAMDQQAEFYRARWAARWNGASS